MPFYHLEALQAHEHRHLSSAFDGNSMQMHRTEGGEKMKRKEKIEYNVSILYTGGIDTMK